MSNSINSKPSVLRALPSVDELLRSNEAQTLREAVGARRLTTLARSVTADLRLALQSRAVDGHHAATQETRESIRGEAIRRLEDACRAENLTGSGRVINATGVILHTNLGRASLSEAAQEALATDAAGYCALEYDVTTGERGRRGAWR